MSLALEEQFKPVVLSLEAFGRWPNLPKNFPLFSSSRKDSTVVRSQNPVKINPFYANLAEAASPRLVTGVEICTREARVVISPWRARQAHLLERRKGCQEAAAQRISWPVLNIGRSSKQHCEPAGRHGHLHQNLMCVCTYLYRLRLSFIR